MTTTSTDLTGWYDDLAATWGREHARVTAIDPADALAALSDEELVDMLGEHYVGEDEGQVWADIILYRTEVLRRLRLARPAVPTPDAGEREAVPTVDSILSDIFIWHDSEGDASDDSYSRARIAIERLAAGYTTRSAVATEIRAMDATKLHSNFWYGLQKVRGRHTRGIQDKREEGGLAAVVEAIAQEVERNGP